MDRPPPYELLIIPPNNAHCFEFTERTRSFLVRLSGRQMKRTRPVTAPALRDGLYKLFAMLETLHHYSLDDLEEFANFAFPRKPLPGMQYV